MSSSADRLRLFDLQRFSIHDGPGIRTVVFLKGCPLSCQWCQNPESIASDFELAFYAERCGGCLHCICACPHGAIHTGAGRVDRTRCQACGNCARACPNEALRLIGFERSAEQVFEHVMRDKPYYEATGGGMTLSGGEPLLQSAPAAQLLRLCRAEGVHTLVETSAAVPFKAFEQVLPHTDLFYFDLKAFPETLHRRLTAGRSARIAKNAERLVGTGAAVAFRMPVVPGFNDTPECIQGIATMLEALGHSHIRLLPYHAGGEAKIERIESGQPRLGVSRERAGQALHAAAEGFRQCGIAAIPEGEVGTAIPEAESNVRIREVEPSAPNLETKGRRSGDEGKTGRAFSERVWRLRQAVQSAAPALCIERAMLVTEYFAKRSNRQKPIVIQKAEALGHVLKNRGAVIYPEELLVGCFSSKRVGGSILPELHGISLLEDLLHIDRRSTNPLAISDGERWLLLTRVMPFWLTRFLALRAFPLPRALRFVWGQLAGRRYLINETGGISHIVPDYGRLLREGTSGLAEEAKRLALLTAGTAKEAGATDDAHEGGDNGAQSRAFYRAVQIVCNGLEDLASAYAVQARRQAAEQTDEKRRHELETIARVCERVPRRPAATLQEALQSILFAQIAINLESLDNSVCPGRLDQVLYPYFRADREAGRIDEQGARELIGCFTVKMSEIVPAFSSRITRFHGGMFNGQVVVAGGVDCSGQDGTNALTWHFLDAMEHLRMRQPNYHARIHRHSPDRYVSRIARMLRDGSGAPALMNDDVVVPMLAARGIALQDARDYSPVGCVEPVACGRSFGSTDAALVNLALCLEWCLNTKPGGAPARPASSCASIHELKQLLEIQVNHMLELLIADLWAIERANARFHPTPLTSALLSGCMQAGKDATAGGSRYNSSGVQAVGIVDVADSLAAMEQVVFDQRLCDMPTLIRALKGDFVGYESLRGHLLKASKYGNDDPCADSHLDYLMKVFAQRLAKYRSSRGGPYWAGFYSVTAHRAFGEVTGALPSARRAGQPLANGLSAANGQDRFGPTAALNSTARLDLAGSAQNGINVNLKIDSNAFGGETGVGALAGLIRGYFDQGGMQVQINALDPNVLREAIRDPERHPWLLVRVSGYSAYFNDLSAEMKQEILDRTLHGC